MTYHDYVFRMMRRAGPVYRAQCTGPRAMLSAYRSMVLTMFRGCKAGVR